MIARIAVQYLHCSIAPHLEGQHRWLDTGSGKVYDSALSRTACGRGYRPCPRTPDQWVHTDGTILEVLQAVAPSTEEPENERGAGLKHDSGKPRWSLLMQGCAKALDGVAKVLTFGAKKYAANSWKQVENNQERYRDALYRHLNALESGEAVDPESGLSHWDHIACNALFLSELSKDNG